MFHSKQCITISILRYLFSILPIILEISAVQHKINKIAIEFLFAKLLLTLHKNCSWQILLLILKFIRSSV